MNDEDLKNKSITELKAEKEKTLAGMREDYRGLLHHVADLALNDLDLDEIVAKYRIEPADDDNNCIKASEWITAHVCESVGTTIVMAAQQQRAKLKLS